MTPEKPRQIIPSANLENQSHLSTGAVKVHIKDEMNALAAKIYNTNSIDDIESFLSSDSIDWSKNC